MKLYHNPASPFVRKVRVLLAETGQQVELVDVFITPTAPGDQVPAANPLGKIPALERDSGATLYDSRVICRYLDDLAGGRLYPEAPRLSACNSWGRLVVQRGLFCPLAIAST